MIDTCGNSSLAIADIVSHAAALGLIPRPKKASNGSSSLNVERKSCDDNDGGEESSDWNGGKISGTIFNF